MTLEIIGIPGSNFVRTVRLVAEEKGVAYELEPARPHSDEVTAIHPLGLVPVMRHEGLELSESMAIARYIDSAFEGPALVPAEPRAAAQVDRWMAYCATSVDQLLMRQYVIEYLFHKDDDGNVVRHRIDKAVRRFAKTYASLEAGVAGGFLGGGSISLADCFVIPMLVAAKNFPEGEAELATNPALTAYFERFCQRPSFAATQP
jgi:glutathione S-transferase